MVIPPGFDVVLDAAPPPLASLTVCCFASPGDFRPSRHSTLRMCMMLLLLLMTLNLL